MFGDTLKAAVDRVDGALACILMGFDGLEVASHTATEKSELPVDPQTLATELSAHLNGLRKTAADVTDGALQEAHVHTGGLQAVARVIDDDYFLLLLLDANGLAGKGRYVLRMLAPKIKEEL